MPERISILHPEFVYVNSANTDIRLLFERVQEQLKKEAKAKTKQEKKARKKAQ